MTLAWDPAAKKLPVLNRPRLARPSVQVAPVKGLRAERVLRSAVPPGWPQARPPVQVTKTTPRALGAAAHDRAVRPYQEVQAPGRVPAVKKPDTGKWLEAREREPAGAAAEAVRRAEADAPRPQPPSSREASARR